MILTWESAVWLAYGSDRVDDPAGISSQYREPMDTTSCMALHVLDKERGVTKLNFWSSLILRGRGLDGYIAHC